MHPYLALCNKASRIDSTNQTASSILPLSFIVASIIASPLAYYFLFRWLNAFAYRIPITWDIFASSLAAVILIASATIGALALKAAMKNPVANLKEAA